MRILGALFAILLTAQTTAAAESEGYGKTQGIIPGVPLVFGPKLSVAFPHPSIGLEVKLDNLVGASFDYGLIPDISFKNFTLGIKGWHLAGRLYPFRGAFFAGVALGRRTFTGSGTVTVGPGTETATLTEDATYLAPEIGWRWVWQSGLFLGVEIGWEFTLSHTRETSPNFATLQSQQPDTYNNIISTSDDIHRIGLPHLGFLQVGYFF